MIKFLIVFSAIFIIPITSAQMHVGVYTEAGKHAASSGFYSEISVNTGASIGEWTLTSAAGIAFQNDRQILLRGLINTVGRRVYFKQSPYTVHVFHLWKPFSDILQEQNLGAFISSHAEPWSWKLGLFTKHYRFTRDTKLLYPDAPHVIMERINIMYQLAYIHHFSEMWSVKGSVTNTDAFVYELDTNPMVIASVYYHQTDQLQWFADLGYRQSGLFNIRVNYYGYFLRGGVRWVL